MKRKLTIFETAGHADVLKAFQKKSRQIRTVEAWEESWIGTGEQLRKTAAEIVPDLLDDRQRRAGPVHFQANLLTVVGAEASQFIE